MSRCVIDDVRNPGDWFIRQARLDDDTEIFGMAFRCCGCGSQCYVPISKEQCEKRWLWDGNLEQPTLDPSLLNRCCGWHGHLREGLWVAQTGSNIPEGANP